MSGDAKALRALVKTVEAQGGAVTRGRRSSHLKVYRGGRLVAVLPSTPSDHRAMKNTIADLRKAGFTL